MQTTPTDRGIAFIASNSDGTSNVYVAAGVDAAGGPESIFAIHFNRRNVAVGSNVDISAAAGSMSRTTGVVRVFSDEDGTVHVLTLRK